MTREEAITVLKAFMKNPLFSEVHKAAFNIAIHDIKAYQDWNINNLILVNKDNYEPLEQEPVIDKIRAEISTVYESLDGYDPDSLGAFVSKIDEIFDRYKADREALADIYKPKLKADLCIMDEFAFMPKAESEDT